MIRLLPDEGVDFKWEDEIEDPTVKKLVGLMRGGHKFQTSDFVGGDSSLPPLIGTSKVTGPRVTKECPQERRRFRKKIEEPVCSSQPQRRPFRPRRGVGVEPESTDSGEINEELKAWICGELSTRIGTLREKIYGWLHPNERCSNLDNRRGRSLDRKCKAGGKKTVIEQS